MRKFRGVTSIDSVRKQIKRGASLFYSSFLCDSLELRSLADNVWYLDEDLNGLTYSYQHDIAPYSDQNIHRRPSPDFLFRRPFVTELQGGIIIGPHASAVTSNGVVVADSLKRPSRHHEIHAHLAATILSKSYARAKLTRTSTPILDSAIILHRKDPSGNFYHWVIERLLTLRGAKLYESKTGSQLTIVISPHAPKFVHKILEYTGFGDNKRIIWDGGPIHVNRLVVPSWPELTPTTLQWLGMTVQNNVETEVESADYLYISRQNSSQRAVVNYDELKPILKKHNVKVVYLEEIDFETEVELLGNAKGIIGPHGAGLTSMIWADDISVLELFNNSIIPPYYIMADVLDFNYTCILGQDAEKIKRRRDRNIYIDPKKFEEKMSKFVI